MSTRLNPNQIKILAYLAKRRGEEDDWHRAIWIANHLGHAYNASWASSRLRALLKRGLVRKDGTGHYYQITDEGFAALKEAS